MTEEYNKFTRRHIRRIADNTWVTSSDEIVPICYMEDMHLLYLGRSLENNARDERKKKLKDLEIQIAVATKSSDVENLAGRIEKLQKDGIINEANEIYPKYSMVRKEAIKRKLITKTQSCTYGAVKIKEGFSRNKGK